MGGSSHFVWYCAHCGDGPHNITIGVACSNCGLRRDSNSTVVSTGEGKSFALLPPPPTTTTTTATTMSYSAPQVHGTNTLEQRTKEPHFVSLADLENELGETVVPKEILADPLELLPKGKRAQEPSSSSSVRDKSSPEGSGASPLSSTSHKSYDTTGEDIRDAGSMESITTERARYLSDIILGGIDFDVDLETRTVSCTGYARTRGYHSTQDDSAARGNDESGTRPSGSTGSGSKRRRETGQDDLGKSKQYSGDPRTDSKKRRSSTSSDNKPLACPFYKMNSRRCARHRACSGPGWTQCYRLK
jgi:hypothetical protein